VAVDEQKWGSFEPETGRLGLHDQPQPGDVDLLNLATIHTLLNDGDVYASEREDVPDAEPAAAILRF